VGTFIAILLPVQRSTRAAYSRLINKKGIALLNMNLPKLALSALGAALCCFSLAFRQTDINPSSPPVATSSAPVMGGPLVWKMLEDEVFVTPGTDGLYHLAYVMTFTNEYYRPVTIKSIEILNPDRDFQPTGMNRILSIKNEDVTGQVRLFSLPPNLDAANFSTQLGPGQAGTVYFDVTYRRPNAIPKHLSHRVTMESTKANDDAVEFVVTDDSVPVSPRQPIVLSPPLRSNGWLNLNGCCKQLGAHRGTFNPLNGAFWQAESYAIDFVAVNQNGLGFTGDGSRLDEYFYYGVDILAAKGGKVVEAVDGLPDQIPNQDSGSPSVDDAAGNHIIVDMGDGQYALYAHLKPYSLTVQVGDTVTDGQKLGLLGNSGNTTGPHLHFQVMDRPSALKANGLPFVFNRFTLTGLVSDSVLGAGNKFGGAIPLPILDRRNPQRNTLPLALDVLNFR
jgi:murein DD-endopeptidase MepM/ murein hydrolase activator NlpD